MDKNSSTFKFEGNCMLFPFVLGRWKGKKWKLELFVKKYTVNQMRKTKNTSFISCWEMLCQQIETRERFHPGIHFISRLSVIVRVSVVLVICTLKVKCITLVDGIKLWLLTWLVNRVFSLSWPGFMQIYWNKRKRLHRKRV